MRIHFNIGSNLGDRPAHICRAIVGLAAALPPGRLLLSDYFESEPWGYVSPNSFLNRGVLYISESDITPLDTLDIAQSIEASIAPGMSHRNPDGSYRDRAIDIDIIDIDGIVMNTPRLVLPHPRAAQRPFVAIPMAELNQRAELEEAFTPQ